MVPTQLVVDHSLAVECGGFDPDAFDKNRAIEDRRNEDRFHFIDWTKKAFKNVDVIPPGNGILHQINLERMSPVVQVKDGVAFPDTLVGTDSHTPMVDALGVIAIGVGGLEAESVMLGRASWMRLPDIIGVELTGKSAAGHHRDRHRAGADRIPAQGESGRRLPGVLRRRRGEPDPGRPRHHLQHGAGIRRHRRDVLHRRADHQVPEAHRPRRRTGQAGGNLRQGNRPVGRQPEDTPSTSAC